jgi:hypothetical protein
LSLVVLATRRHGADEIARNPRHVYVCEVAGRLGMTYDIFGGTEQIQQLVISRAISGLRIE